MNQPQTCLTERELQQVANDEFPPGELRGIEEHVTHCRRCRTLFDTTDRNASWSPEIRTVLTMPAEPEFPVTDEDSQPDHKSVLSLLGPTDDPQMLGRIGAYEVMGIIGRGGMGVVFKAFEPALDRLVAIKMLLPHLAALGAARKRFSREGQAAAAVIDDHVLPIYSVDEWQGTPYLVTQYSRGTTLQQRIQDRGPLELKEILRIALQTARGLAAAHAQGLVHRDVKPSNILLDGTVERAVLTDFGLARAVDDASVTRTGTVTGTPQYMSPEQVRGESVDARSDLFSLGSTMYAMCTGRSPFRSDSTYGVMHRIGQDEPPSISEINPDIPGWLCNIVRKLMSKRRDDRFDSADELAVLLEKYLAHVQQPTDVPLPESRLSLGEISKKKKNAAMTVSRASKAFLATVAAAGMLVVGILIAPQLDDKTAGERESADAPAQAAKGQGSVPLPDQADVPASSDTPVQAMRRNPFRSSRDPDAHKHYAPEQPAQVLGTVVDVGGQPVAGALLSLVLYSHLPEYDRRPAPPTTVWATAKSSADGSFAMDYKVGDPEFYRMRTYRLVAIAQKDGRALGWQFIEFKNRKAVVKIRLPDEQVRRGRLVDLEGQPVAGATVHVVGLGKPAPKWRNVSWYPQNGMPADEATTTKAPVDENDELWQREVRLRIPPLGLTSWPKAVTSDAQGRFEIRGTGAEQAIAFHAYGTDQAGSIMAEFAADEGASEPKTFVLDVPRTIFGQVKDKLTGKPVAGAKVRVDATWSVTMEGRAPILADWKGRQEHVGNLQLGPGNPTRLRVPPVFTTTDAQGHYRISTFRNETRAQHFAITVLSPDDGSYLSSKKSMTWPGAAFRNNKPTSPEEAALPQRVDLELTPGVRIAGQVLSSDNEPVPLARIDFWSRQLKYPHDYMHELGGGTSFGMGPDGVQHPYWRKTGFDGQFNIIVPRGKSMLLVNTGSDETLVDRVEAEQLGLTIEEIRKALSFYPSFQVPMTSVEPYRFYPDRAVPLDYADDQQADDLSVRLHPQAPTLTVEIVNATALPNPEAQGLLPEQPEFDLRFYAGQAPFKHPAADGYPLIKRVGNNRFAIRCYDQHSPVSLVFLDDTEGLGLHKEILCEDISAEVVKLQLQSLGEAKVKFVDSDHRPLGGLRPLCWMSVPRQPFSTAADLEELASPFKVHTRQGEVEKFGLKKQYDSIWTEIVHESTHGSLRADVNGDVTFKSLIPGATYRISQFGDAIKDFRVQPGKTIDLGEVVINDREATLKFPTAD
jgi:serine/threonine protein kinase